MNHLSLIKTTLIYCFCTLLISCGAFTYGFTEDESFGTYNIISKERKTFGNKRLKSNKRYHNNSELYFFLIKKGDPDFIYEYEKDNGCDGIILFYPILDSAFVFEESDKNDFMSSQKIESRTIKENEKTYLNQFVR